ncbi:cytochrome P450 [Phaeosphaeriaceae sp. PMI808]|nr:cytochrome P450 [Phaeosphaeriaceae sp. PMI808]
MEKSFYLFAFMLGCFVHVVVFSRNEWDRHSPWILLFFCLLSSSTFILFPLGLNYSYLEALLQTNLLGSSLLGGLFSSMLSYRLLFHPLKSFPGPIGARISAFWISKESIPDMKFYHKLHKIHDHYGDFVRIRPRELSIRHPDAIVDVHGPRSRILKGEFYEQMYPLRSLQLNRDAVYHKTQRKYWDKAFQTKALNDYTHCLKFHYTILMRIFDESAATRQPVDASELLLDLFFDIVSELTFGKSFNTLSEKKRNLIIGEFLKHQKVAGFMLQHMWLFHLIKCIPAVQARIKYWIAWYSKALEERKQMQIMSSDFYTYLSQSDNFDIDGTQEAQLGIIAGADTNAITVSNTFYLLCRYPDYQERLYQELKDVPVSNGGVIDDQHLVGKHNLSAIIYEVLRLYPPVPSGLQRLTPPEGATIAGQFVPGNMIISTPTYAIQRDPRAFVRPNEFIPERWTSQPELILRKEAFVAFGYGAYNCAGKPLAMLQLRMVIAMIIRRFEISIPPGQEDVFKHFIEEQSDCFTLHLNPLPLSLKKRDQ